MIYQISEEVVKESSKRERSHTFAHAQRNVALLAYRQRRGIREREFHIYHSSP